MLFPLLVGVVLGFIIRGRPRDDFSISTGKKVGLSLVIAFVGILLVYPVVAARSLGSTSWMGQYLLGFSLGVYGALSLGNDTYKKWVERKALVWLFVILVVVFVITSLLRDSLRRDLIGDRSNQDSRVSSKIETPLEGEAVTDDRSKIDDQEPAELAPVAVGSFTRSRAEAGDVEYQRLNGDLFATGQGQYGNGQDNVKDNVEAYFWWTLAASQGDEKAKQSALAIEKFMSEDEIARAKERAATWKPLGE
jgi:hypothetical protein